MSKLIDFTKLLKYKDQYQTNKPFPHCVVDGLWDNLSLKKAEEEVSVFNDWDGEKDFDGAISKRFCSQINRMPPKVKEILQFCNSPDFIENIETLTGENSLIPDPYLFGGGIFSTRDSGFLKMHADFNWHKKIKLYRRINVLIYLNSNWDPNWGADLKLAVKNKNSLDVKVSIDPLFNRTVVFTSTDHSYHGHPTPLNGPQNTQRNALVIYYYVSTKPLDSADLKRTGTDYRNSDGKKLITFRRRIFLKLKSLIPNKFKSPPKK